MMRSEGSVESKGLSISNQCVSQSVSIFKTRDASAPKNYTNYSEEE